ncbi:helicase-related protein [Pseudozobellia thermophila]|uniref:Helicase conserved C-terminal domain-containing protein n=1 Tax=Pseudozobellia thermophila TaxID=192903 RepID=A0A1M6BDA9_9FLAO|nr:helicase-related protein [Pseudozobellia thermophila]SHI46721.1 Helicase conserved C-terminal domain-containing protein [Pseudozobellia thermophila]
MIRDQIIDDIIKEVCGPDPHPAYIDETTGEEILLERVHGSPKLRYGAGMLYPQATNITELDENTAITDDDVEEEPSEYHDDSRTTQGSLADDGDSDESIGLANEFLPSAMGFTCKMKADHGTISVHINAAWYERSNQGIAEKRVVDRGYEDKRNTQSGAIVLRRNWTRRPLDIKEVVLDLKEIGFNRGLVFEKVVAVTPWNTNQDWLTLRVYNRSRKEHIDKGECILTFTIINKILASTNQEENDRAILFQNKIYIKDESGGHILPYDERNSANDTEEEEELLLLYREKKTYAIGHGCSVQWDESNDRVYGLATSVVPVYELPQVSPTQHVTLSMLELSDYGDWDDAKASLNQLTTQYEIWISNLELAVGNLDEKFQGAALRNVSKCKENLRRIKEGVQLLTESDVASDLVKCFRWMNRAMIWQQQRSKTPRRSWIREDHGSYVLTPLEEDVHQHADLSEFHKGTYNGKWRPFQIAFVLMNLISIWDENSKQREIVDLIWFPTGGGKTEAYLGLAGFSIFARRIRAKANMDFDYVSGTSILMRYTLRLLTTQQYERASSLICACELIRKEDDNMLELGPDPFSIGLWVGGTSTPNKRKHANELYRELTGRNFQSADYNFIVTKCPCCGAAIGKLDSPSRHKRVSGLAQTDGSVSAARTYFRCENEYCEFFESELPLYVVDEDIFEFCPTLVLGTVDKFAMIPWQPGRSSNDFDSGKLFGFRSNGVKSRITPPELIIQDELHLISGPLGTVVGLYESLVITLCNNYNKREYPFHGKDYVPPKIVASSATISRASEQVKALYASDNLNIFPPQGINFGDTWFSEEKEPSPENPGRKYIGVLAPGYRSGQTSVVRLYASILQSIRTADYPPETKDYYWTLLGFFNSIRELGMAASLIYADIRDYLSILQKRKLIPYEERRWLKLFKELTSRIASSKIPDALKELEKSYTGKTSSALDVCLATNMIATGVDVSRLGLMLIHGQPKTTAEYIQASSRVGRDIKGPGLVIMLYSPSKPRDKSQYEHFQSFHNKIYSYVEPTSVTPFSINARERVLHAVIIGLVRSFSEGHFTRNPDISNNEAEFKSLTDWVREVIKSRCGIIDPSEVQNTMALFDKRIAFWKNGFQEYGDPGNYGILNKNWVPLMYAIGNEVTEDIRNGGLSLPSLTSMRGVDEEGRIGIMNLG